MAKTKVESMSAVAKPVTGQKGLSWEEMRPDVTDELLADVTRRIVDQFHPYKVILFGSYAWGKPHVDSDLDLFVVMESDQRPAMRGAAVYEAAYTPFLPMDVLVYTPKELAERLSLKDSFIRSIVEDGRVLYNRV